MSSTRPTPSLRAVSGTGGKGPACFLVETPEARLLLDLGYGPRPGLLPEVGEVGTVDALLLSHGHRDHAGGLALLPKVGNPRIYATDIVAARMRPGLVTGSLPMGAEAEIAGIRVRTGRSGHAPGGVWIHLALGSGLLYMGDNSSESILYACDAPPPAATVIIDASYGADDTALTENQEQFEALFRSGAVLLPVPADGRGPEIALYLARKGYPTLRIDETTRSSLKRMGNTEGASLRQGAAAELARIADTAQALDGPHGIMLAARADGTEGEAARLIKQWENEATPAIVFTGDLTPGTPAERLVKSGRARDLLWNVHPRLSDNVALLCAVKARTVVPAFCGTEHFAALSHAFAPARVSVDMPIAL